MKRVARGHLIALRRVAGLPSEMSDEALLAACAVGDSAALGALYDRLQPHIWRFLSRLAGRRDEELEDLVQATFVAIHGAASRFRRNATVRTWALAIAANVSRRHVRDEVRRRSAFGRLAMLPVGMVKRPDESAEETQLMVRLRAAMSAIPHHLRVALVMCDIEEIPGREVASVLEIPEGTLYRRIHDARRALRTLMEEEQP